MSNQSVFSIRNVPVATAKLFFDEAGTVDIQRYEVAKHPIFQKLLDQQLSFFWRPQEISLTKDIADFKTLNEAQEHVFTSNIKRQILLDSVQGRAPFLCFGPVCSDPIVESWLSWWTAFENLHSMSYTHIIRLIYPDPSKVFDEMTGIKELVDCGSEISKAYDELLYCIKTYPYGDYRTKTAFWKSIISTNALEQIRFQVSFACTFSFGKQNLMVGTSKIISLIQNDESLHAAFTQNLCKILPLDDPDFEKIREEQKEYTTNIYLQVREQEQDWVRYLFKKGPIFGLTEEELCLYLDFLTARKMKQLHLDVPFDAPSKNPLSWITRFEDGTSDQVAPQEQEIISYQIGNIDMDFDKKDMDFDF